LRNNPNVTLLQITAIPKNKKAPFYKFPSPDFSGNTRIDTPLTRQKKKALIPHPLFIAFTFDK